MRGSFVVGVVAVAALALGCGGTLRVIVAGAGLGTVTGPGVNCRGICSTTTKDPALALAVTADGGSTFGGWAGACTGSSPSCSASLSGGGTKTVVAYFRRTTVSAGAFHTCALKQAGDLECWGRNSEGQLADGTTTSPHDGFIKINPSFKTFVDVAAGGLHTCALAPDSTVWCWGNNTWGQAGTRTYPPPPSYSSPQQTAVIASSVPTLTLPGAIAITSGGYHSCAVLMDQSVACWGYNKNGQVDATRAGIDAYQPGLVSGISGAVGVAAGAYHSCSLDAAGKVTCWGYNADYELGVPVPSEGFASGNVGNVPGPSITASRIVGAMGGGVMGLAQHGGFHSCAILASGAVACWGFDKLGQLSGITGTASATPLTGGAITTPSRSIAAGGYHSCSVAGGAVQCWGSNSNGQIGNGSFSGGTTSVTTVTGVAAASIVTAGAYHTCVVDGISTVRCWGLNDHGQVGRRANNTKADPELTANVPLGF